MSRGVIRTACVVVLLPAAGCTVTAVHEHPPQAVALLEAVPPLPSEARGQAPDVAPLPAQLSPVAPSPDVPSPQLLPPVGGGSTRRPVRDWLTARRAALAERPVKRWFRGLVVNESAPDPNVRMDQLLSQSDDQRQVGEQWRRFWLNDAPQHLTPERITGGVMPDSDLPPALLPTPESVRELAPMPRRCEPERQHVKRYPTEFAPDPVFPLQREQDSMEDSGLIRREPAPMPRRRTPAVPASVPPARD